MTAPKTRSRVAPRRITPPAAASRGSRHPLLRTAATSLVLFGVLGLAVIGLIAIFGQVTSGVVSGFVFALVALTCGAVVHRHQHPVGSE